MFREMFFFAFPTMNLLLFVMKGEKIQVSYHLSVIAFPRIIFVSTPLFQAIKDKLCLSIEWMKETQFIQSLPYG